LKDCTSLETGLGYNVLFERTQGKIGSRRTFDKYLKELESDGVVHNDKDPRHKKGRSIYLNSANAKTETLLLEAQKEAELLLKAPIKRYKKYLEELTLVPGLSPKKQAERLLKASKEFGSQSERVIRNLVLWHSIYFKMHDEVPADTYISVRNDCLYLLQTAVLDDLMERAGKYEKLKTSE
jgi:hypothetical protein